MWMRCRPTTPSSTPRPCRTAWVCTPCRTSWPARGTWCRPPGGFDAAEMFSLGWQLGPLSTFAAPTIVKRLVDHAEHAGLSPADAARAFKTIVYGGAPMYLADIQRALRVMGPRFVQIYGQGETPMVATVLARAHIVDAVAPAACGATGLGGRGADAGAGARGRRTRPATCLMGEIGEVLVRGDSGHGRLLAQPRGHGCRVARRLAVHRRRGLPRRARLSHAQGPQQGPHHQRRLQHLPA